MKQRLDTQGVKSGCRFNRIVGRVVPQDHRPAEHGMIEIDMDKDLEDELLMHIAAGTDIPTAFAVLPRDEQPAASSNRGWLAVAILIGVFIAWLVSR